ncbi:TetR/AcrR family transcriptional regulator [Hydrogenophaga taeniospiralis]|uniref:TetR/AcrR family transcriptional regulator n=1 Tax=Hydrogenophaga taeniospiralis TaxID=65656 RepID=UPI001CFBBFF3|nr:TetR/AcrR family transcriptional regulator [Hydrogenophaga taeniospiralis]MDP2019652.1 TetR/AcrR family transcriptional regulator [Hydrogenophaga sp.]UCU93519.1 TetR/AcrR family transcriptional regulator [Hydrogenophaga taeniospiralis]
MKKAVQQRTLETRSRLTSVADQLVAEKGFEALRIEETVQAAGVAKGTFFAHFKDKDELMDLLIGQRIETLLDRMAAEPAPRDADQLAQRLMPLVELMSSERYVFDLIMRRSGAMAVEEIGPIALSFGRLGELVGQWLAQGAFRRDVPIEILVEGVEAFLMQTLALNFCALHKDKTMKARLQPYLRAWLAPVAV